MEYKASRRSFHTNLAEQFGTVNDVNMYEFDLINAV